MNWKFGFPTILLIALIVSAAVFVWVRGKDSSPSKVANTSQTETKTESTPATESAAQSTSQSTKTLRAADIANVDNNFKFSAEIPSKWQAEAITAIDSINIYDPTASGDSNLEKSQIFIRQFSANSFLTLSTVTVHSREDLTLNSRPAVRYDIEKKAGVANFANQPTWRSARHIVTDIRVSDSNPSVFYVIGQRPGLSDDVYQDILNSINVIAKESSLIEPIDEFKTRITKKPFGILIDPATSPIQPEKFSGYHTAVDVEYDDKPGVDIPVRAIAAGTVLRATTASGYGGVLVISHEINGDSRAVIYGHLDAKSLPKVGAKVSAGQQVGILGEPPNETDGERKHLHFGVRKDNANNILGYVGSKEELNAGWQNPLELF